MKKRMAYAAVVAILVISIPAFADYVDVSFSRITGNFDQDIASQLNLRIWEWDQANVAYPGLTDLNATQVLFIFTNNVGAVPSNVSDIYIDDGTIVGLSQVYNNLSGSTLFNQISSPPPQKTLPGGNTLTPPFEVTNVFSVDAQGQNGINSSTDVLGIVYSLQTGLYYADVLDALNDGSLRIGLHVQSIGTEGKSDSFINNPNPEPGPNPIPEPASLLLLGAGLAGLGIAALRRKAK